MNEQGLGFLLPLMLIAAAEGFGLVWAGEGASDAEVWAKVTQCHDLMWKHYVDPGTRQVYTYLDPQTLRPRLPSPEDVAAKKPNAGGWGTAIENCSLDGGVYLGALVDRYAVTGKAEDAEEARRIAHGLLLIAKSARRAGCIPRGVLPDGKTHYPESSVDQYTMYVYGLWRYYRSPIPGDEHKRGIRDTLGAMLKRLEEDKYVILTDEGGKTTFGDLDARRPSRAERLLAVVLAGADITGDAHWLAEYERLRAPRLAHCRGTGGQPWVLLQNQLAFFLLRRLEKSPEVCRVYEAGSLEAAQNCLPHLPLCAGEDGKRDMVKHVINPLEGALTVALAEKPEMIREHLGQIRGILVAYDYTRPLVGGKFFVNAVRPVECIAWSLAGQGFLRPSGGR